MGPVLGGSRILEPPEDGTDSFSRNAEKKLPLLACVITQKSAVVEKQFECCSTVQHFPPKTFGKLILLAAFRLW